MIAMSDIMYNIINMNYLLILPSINEINKVVKHLCYSLYIFDFIFFANYSYQQI